MADKPRKQSDTSRGAPPKGAKRTSGQRGNGGDDRKGGGGKGSSPRSQSQRSQSQRSQSSDRKSGSRRGQQPRRRPFTAEGGPSNLPNWLREEVARVTPKERREGALRLLSEAASDFADEKYGLAHAKLLKAKKLSSQAAAIRELLGLSAYRTQRWEEALRELRTYRRIAGDTTHMPIEMDTLRALERHADVRKTWELYQELGGRPATESEARVVYGSFLLDDNNPREAWNVTKPRRLTKDAPVHELRRWYVAARAAAALGDTETARQISNAIESAETEIPGLDALDREIQAAEARASR